PIGVEGAERKRYRELRGRFAAGYSAFQRAQPDAAWSEFVHASKLTVQGRAALAAWREYRALLAYPRGKRLAVREILAQHPGSRALVVTVDNETGYESARRLMGILVAQEILRPGMGMEIEG